MFGLNYTKAIILVMMCMQTLCETDLDDIVVNKDELDGEKLIDVGRKSNKTLLTIVGYAMVNYHRCGQWSQWTECTADVPNSFGLRTRAKTCGMGTNTRKHAVTEFCEGKCPGTYIKTENGLCLRLYYKSTRTNADNTCSRDGGYLLNFDSEKKGEAIKSILIPHSTTVNEIHINGKRKNALSPWEFTYGSMNGNMTWRSGYPVHKDTHGFLMLSTRNYEFQFYNLQCSGSYYYFCEIPV